MKSAVIIGSRSQFLSSPSVLNFSYSNFNTQPATLSLFPVVQSIVTSAPQLSSLMNQVHDAARNLDLIVVIPAVLFIVTSAPQLST